MFIAKTTKRLDHRRQTHTLIVYCIADLLSSRFCSFDSSAKSDLSRLVESVVAMRARRLPRPLTSVPKVASLCRVHRPRSLDPVGISATSTMKLRKPPYNQ